MNAPTAQHAPEATVDALMYDLRERGLRALSIRTNQARFAALSPEQSKTIEGFRSQVLAIRSQLRDVQFALSRDVDNLKNWVTAANVGGVPVAVGVIALAFGMRRSRRPLPKKPSDTAA